MRGTSKDPIGGDGDAGRNPVPTTLLPVLLLFALTILAQLLSLAFGRLDSQQSFSEILPASLLYLSILTLPACCFGVILGRRIGLGVTQLDHLLARRPGAAQALKGDAALAVVLGFSAGVILLVLRVLTEPYLPPELPQLGFRGITGGLAVSLGAAVAEEVWFRLGLMTLLLWCITRLKGDRSPSDTMIWSVIVLSAIAFAAAHLPQLIAYDAGSVVGIAGTLFGNVLVGTLYGWLYWQKGIIAAMVSHFSVDLVLHVLSVAFW